MALVVPGRALVVLVLQLVPVVVLVGVLGNVFKHFPLLVNQVLRLNIVDLRTVRDVFVKQVTRCIHPKQCTTRVCVSVLRWSAYIPT